MAYLIDGHNLIPKLGYSLGDEDIENILIEKLQVFCCTRKTTVEVFFDGGLPGQPANIKLGYVKAHFVRKGKTADSAIEVRLQKLGKSAKNWTVVSSDHRIQMAAREVHARSSSSEVFSSLLMDTLHHRSEDSSEDVDMNPADVSLWLKEFGQDQES